MKSLKDIRTQIDEVLTKKDPAAKWIHDFVHSDNPQFAGKSMAKRRQMALAAYYSKKNEAAFVSTSMQTDIKGDLGEAFLSKKEEDDLDNLSSDEFTKKYGRSKHAHRKSHATRASDLEKFTESQEEDDRRGAEHNQKELEQQQQELEAKKKKEKVKEAVEYKGIGTDVVDKKKVLNPPIPLTQKKKTVKDFKEEIVNELSKNTLNSYIDKAKHQADWAHTMRFMDQKQADDMIKKREAGIGHAINKKANKEYTKEETINELKASTLKSYSNKSWQKGLDAAYDAAHNIDKEKNYQLASKRFAGSFKAKSKLDKMKEEVQIDEISKKTLGSYIKKAAGSLDGIGHHAYEAGRRGQEGGKNFAKALKRIKGVGKATDKLTKEETVEESRGHKVLSTFFKNREVAQKAFTGQNKPAEKKPEPEKKEVKEGFDDYHAIAKELVKRHGNKVDTGHINDLAGERDSHRGLDHSEVMHHVNKLLGAKKEVKEGEVYDEKWKKFKKIKEGVSMLNFNDFLKEAWQEGAGKAPMQEKLVGKQHKLDKNKNGKLDSDDFKKLRNEGKKCMDEDDVDESGLRMASHAAHKAGKKEFEFQGKSYPVKIQKEETELEEGKQGLWANIHAKRERIKRGSGEKMRKPGSKGAPTDKALKDSQESVQHESVQINEISKKTLGSYVNKAAKDARMQGQIATDFENQGDKARKQSKKDSFERLHRKYLAKSWKREDGIAKAVNKLTKEEVQIDEGKMKELAMDLKDMSHDEFHKTYGKPKSHYDPTSFKKPVQPGKEMDRARALAQRGMKSLSKEEVEAIEGKLAQLGEGTYKPEVEKSFPASGVKTGTSAPKGTSTMPKDKEKAKGQPAGSIGEDEMRFPKDGWSQNDSMAKPVSSSKAMADHSKYFNKVVKLDPKTGKPVKEEVETVSEDNHAMAYVNATLAVMDESKYDDLQDKLRAKRATQSAYDKDYKQDKSHPSISLHKGTSYGGQAQKDDEGDEKPEVEKEKRGRGRPHGSKSGARQKGNGREDGGIPVHNLHLPNRNK